MTAEDIYSTLKVGMENRAAKKDTVVNSNMEIKSIDFTGVVDIPVCMEYMTDVYGICYEYNSSNILPVPVMEEKTNNINTKGSHAAHTSNTATSTATSTSIAAQLTSICIEKAAENSYMSTETLISMPPGQLRRGYVDDITVMVLLFDKIET